MHPELRNGRGKGCRPKKIPPVDERGYTREEAEVEEPPFHNPQPALYSKSLSTQAQGCWASKITARPLDKMLVIA